MKKLAFAMVIVLVAVSLTGCRTIGQDFDQQVISRIEKGKTSRAQVQDWLGAPYEKGLQGKYVIWTYRFIKASMQDENSKELTIWFEKNGRVNTFSYTTNFAPWQVSK